MIGPTIRFADGETYERSMGVWSRLAGEVFVDWLNPPVGLRWLDVGCGSGAFTQLLADRFAPVDLQGIDPSEGQLTTARARPAARIATFRQGDAMELPYDTDMFDAAAMALVIFFVPEPAKGVAEMARVVRAGGIVGAYAWDLPGGGFPGHPIRAELRARNIAWPAEPSLDASRIDIMRDLWIGAGLVDVETREITVSRSFADFEEFWTITTAIGNTRPLLEAMTPEDRASFKASVQAGLSTEASGPITYTARANAVKGHVPG